MSSSAGGPAHIDAPTSRESLGARARQSVIWNTGLSFLTSIGQFGLMLVLVRLLAPEIYGQFGFLMAVMGFLFVFSAQGVVDYALQVRGDQDVPTAEIFIFANCMALVLFVVANMVAVGAAFLPKYEQISGLLHLMSLTFFLHPARALRVSMLQRALDWKRIRILHLIGFVASAIISIALALLGAGIYALIASSFLVPLPYILDLFLVARWRPRRRWRAERFKPALTFGLNRQLSEILAAGRRLLESTFVVQVLGFSSFGIYGRALGLSDILCTRIAGQTLEALYPAITRIETESDRFRRVSALVLRACVWMICPLCAVMALLADPIVRIVLGEKWLLVIPILPWVLAMACSGAILQTLYRLMLGHGQQRHCLYLDAIAFTGTLAALVFLLPDGLLLYVKGLVATQLAGVVAASYFLAERGGIAVGALMESFLAPVVPVCAAWLVASQLGAEPTESPSIYAMVVFQIAGFLLTYLILARVLFARQLSELFSYLPFGRSFGRLLALG